MVAPTLEDSFCRASNLTYLGFRRAVAVRDALFSHTHPDNTDDDQRLLYSHVRLACSVAGQMLTFALLMQSPPWVYALLLCDDPVAVRETVQLMKQIW